MTPRGVLDSTYFGRAGQVASTRAAMPYGNQAICHSRTASARPLRRSRMALTKPCPISVMEYRDE